MYFVDAIHGFANCHGLQEHITFDYELRLHNLRFIELDFHHLASVLKEMWLHISTTLSSTH